MTTQGAIFNYEEVIDLHTEVGRVSVIGLHTPTGSTPRQLCPGFFQQFKRYKYLGCSVSVVPVATLPADPLSVSYEAGEPTMDPRDLANPMMFHGCHGNDLGNILNRLYSAGLVDGTDLTQILRSDSLDLMNMFNAEDDGEPVLQLLENLYYRALTDNTWKKAHIQRGFRKSGLRPRIYSLATNMQIQNAGSLGGGFNAPGPFQGDLDLDPLDPSSSGFSDLTDPTVNPVRYFTPRTVPLGWLDTRQVVPYVPEGNVGSVPFADLDETIAGLVRGKTIWNELPKIFMGIILMPPAYKTEQYFRVIINHAFAFKGFRGISMSNDMLELPPNYENWNDLLSDGDSGDEPEPDPPEPDPPSEASMVLSVLDASQDLFRGVVFNDGTDIKSAAVKTAQWSAPGTGFDSANGSAPYGVPRFHYLASDVARMVWWDGTGFKYSDAGVESGTYMDPSTLYTAMSNRCTLAGISDFSALAEFMKIPVTDIHVNG